jgi:hypothetical protein
MGVPRIPQFVLLVLLYPSLQVPSQAPLLSHLRGIAPPHGVTNVRVTQGPNLIKVAAQIGTSGAHSESPPAQFSQTSHSALYTHDTPSFTGASIQHPTSHIPAIHF